MEQITQHPDLQGLRRMLLATRDAHALYAKFGFKPLAAPDIMMEVHNPNAYGGSSKSATPAPKKTPANRDGSGVCQFFLALHA
jgi:hypothetical protein